VPKSSADSQRQAGMPKLCASPTNSGLPNLTPKSSPNFFRCFQVIEP
jgi:hypothetical protein